MCGIGGILIIGGRGDPSSIPERWLDVLEDAVRHRGPDGRGRLRATVRRADGEHAEVAMVHRRLSIIDHAGGAQPLLVRTSREGPGRTASLSLLHASPDGPGEYRAANPGAGSLAAVVFNGCIYNHRALRADLCSLGCEFTSDHADTEVLPHAWNRWGEGSLARLDAMYAAAIWSGETGDVTLLRDPFGEKPLYWSSWDLPGGVRVRAWSSSYLALARLAELVSPGTDAPDAGAVRGWIALGWHHALPNPRVREVSPGCVVRLAEAASTTAPASLRAWRARLSGGMPDDAGARTPDEVDQALRAAVHSRLESDVALACFLSGGIDSALVARYASERVPGLTALTVRMPSPEYDESADANRTASLLGIRCETLDCEADPAGDLVREIGRLGLPFGDSSLLPSLWVSRAARERVKVALGGDGGDELFLGYERQRAARWLACASHLPPGLLAEIAGHLDRGAQPRSTRARAARFLHAAGARGYADLMAIFPSHMLRRLLPGWSGSTDPLAFMPPPGDAWSEAGFEGIRHAALTGYLALDLLRKADSASMSVSLELRAPMLERRVALMATATPRRRLLRGGRKGLLREVAARYLPREVVDRPKRGFAVPIGEWFRTGHAGMRALLLDTLGRPDPFPASRLGLEVDRGFVDTLVREHSEGVRDHSQRLYQLLVLSLWGGG